MNRLVIASLLVLCAVVTAHPPLPVFPQSFTVTEYDDLLVHQGLYLKKPGQVCCDKSGNCEVQTESSSGINYVDATNQRTRFDQAGQSTYIVTLLGNTQKELLVEADGTCKEFCPTQGEEVGGFGPDPNSTWVGETTINGKTVQNWQYNQTFLGIIVMETNDFYADQSGATPVPVLEEDILTPFGVHIGGQNATWSSWKPGVPEASLFDVKGLSSCPEAQNCNSNERTSSRIRNKFWRTFLYHRYGPNSVQV